MLPKNHTQQQRNYPCYGQISQGFEVHSRETSTTQKPWHQKKIPEITNWAEEHHLPMKTLDTLLPGMCLQKSGIRIRISSLQVFASKLGSGLRLIPLSRGEKGNHPHCFVLLAGWHLVSFLHRSVTTHKYPNTSPLPYHYVCNNVSKKSQWFGLCRTQHSLSLWTNRHHCRHEKRLTRLRSFHEKEEGWTLRRFSSLKCAFPHSSVCMWIVFGFLYLIQSLLLTQTCEGDRISRRIEEYSGIVFYATIW